jgi:hypothetical protein
MTDLSLESFVRTDLAFFLVFCYYYSLYFFAFAGTEDELPSLIKTDDN